MDPAAPLLTIVVIVTVVVIWAASSFRRRRRLFSAKTPPEVSRPGEARHWFLAVVGEGGRNTDGSSRQKIIARCAPGEPIRLIRERSNPHDGNAIRVCRVNGEVIGYIGREHAERLAPELDEGRQFWVEIASIHGGHGRKRSRGVVLRVAVPGEEPK